MSGIWLTSVSFLARSPVKNAATARAQIADAFKKFTDICEQKYNRPEVKNQVFHVGFPEFLWGNTGGISPSDKERYGENLGVESTVFTHDSAAAIIRDIQNCVKEAQLKLGKPVMCVFNIIRQAVDVDGKPLYSNKTNITVDSLGNVEKHAKPLIENITSLIAENNIYEVGKQDPSPQDKLNMFDQRPFRPGGTFLLNLGSEAGVHEVNVRTCVDVLRPGAETMITLVSGCGTPIPHSKERRYMIVSDAYLDGTGIFEWTGSKWKPTNKVLHEDPADINHCQSSESYIKIGADVDFYKPTATATSLNGAYFEMAQDYLPDVSQKNLMSASEFDKTAAQTKTSSYQSLDPAVRSIGGLFTSSQRPIGGLPAMKTVGSDVHPVQDLEMNLSTKEKIESFDLFDSAREIKELEKLTELQKSEDFISGKQVERKEGRL
ncbi:hypothetical protein NM208_g3610 [Fusarium decemcellulare]|uniref:Uncharacterized protein n=1 Tax=Fusarium decemcellulare TaxID=57161 RepID=A0ACC1SP06_9HYPO|nr:hypothetical protein NM208_g3610 [Fusarium decemcellulare]